MQGMSDLEELRPSMSTKPSPPPPPPLPFPMTRWPSTYSTRPKKNFDPVRLHFAINKNDADDARCQIERGVNLDFIIHGNTPLTLAIVKENYHIATLITRAGADVNLPEKTKWRRQPVHLAAKAGEVSLLDELISHGASVQAADNMEMTPLHWAAVNGHVAVVSRLLALGAHVNVKDDRGRTPLFRAVEGDFDDVAGMLVENGASVNARDMYGWTPLVQCIVCNQLTMAQRLLLWGAQVNVRDNRGETTLHTVAGRLRPHNLLTLCRTHTDFYTRHLKVATPAVHCAMRHVTDEHVMLCMLLDAGADVNLRNAQGETPLGVAAEEGSDHVLQWLVQAGADLGRETWLLTGNWPAKLQARNSALCERLTEQATRCVRPLTLMCKFAIRKSLRCDLSSRIETLPLPTRLRSFLQLDL